MLPMADTSGSARADVNEQFSDVSRYSFYQLTELLYRLCSVDPEILLSLPPRREPVHFSSYSGLGFPKSDVVSIDRDEQGQFKLEVSFLGLHGSQSPLPSYYLDSLAWEDAQNESRLTDFLNLFNHRLVSLLYHIWRKYRYHVCFSNDGMDNFSQKIFALVGLGNEAIKDSLPVNRSKMLAYAGLLASPGRSPDVICGLVSHCFDLPDVEVDSWQFRKVDILPDEQNRLGSRVKLRAKHYLEKSVLGVNFTLGAKVPDRSGKFMLSINNLTRQRFLNFLPNGKNYIPLVTFVSFILRDQFAWDLKLGLATQQVGGMSLGEEERSQLGWTTFLGQPEEQPNVTICVRE